ncbi:MAG: dihydrofolate reductase [Pseudomonadota bacterium]|jgi:dihydrofolate reductase
MAEPLISLIVARADNGVIGRAGGLPWHLSADLKRVKALTMGKPIVMGSKTFRAIGKALPGRHNIVISRDPAFAAPGATVVDGLASALAAAGCVPEIIIFGGAKIYALALPLAQRIYLTEVHARPEGDTLFPQLGKAWREVAREDHPAQGTAPAYSFVTLARR